jgi:hypothetical protein
MIAYKVLPNFTKFHGDDRPAQGTSELKESSALLSEARNFYLSQFIKVVEKVPPPPCTHPHHPPRTFESQAVRPRLPNFYHNPPTFTKSS